MKLAGARATSLLVALVVVLALLILFQPGCSFGDDQDEATSGDWIYLTTVSIGVAVLVVVIVVNWRRGLNPHTGLRARIRLRRRRAFF